MSKIYTNARAYGNNILYRWIEDGSTRQAKVRFQPTLHLISNTPTEFKTLDGRYAKEVKCGDIKDCKEFIKQYEGVQGFEILGNTKWQYQFISDEYPTVPVYNIDDICIARLDIEVDSSRGFPDTEKADSPITMIGCGIGDTIWVYGLKDYTPKDPDVKYIKCNSEYELISCFLNRWAERHPDIVTGWNVQGFDIPYMVRRMYHVVGEKLVKQKLSPWGIIQERTFQSQYGGGKTNYEYDILGVSTVCMMLAYQKFTFKKRESYKLDYIGEVEVGENKVDYESLGYTSLHDLYARNHDLYTDYNIQDVRLIDKLEDKLKLLQTILTLAYMSRTNFEDPFFQVRMWDALIYNELKHDNIVIPQPVESSKDSKYAGAYVKEPMVGMHKNVASFDLDALYPSLVMQYNISPETFVEPQYVPEELKRTIGHVSVDTLLNEENDLTELSKHWLTMTPNGQFFRTEEMGFLPKIISRIYTDRKIYKKQMLDAENKKIHATTPEDVAHYAKEQVRYKVLQMAMKVTLNSAYGALGNQYFRFFDVRQASAITTSGQLAIRWVEKELNGYMNKVLGTSNHEYVFYVDTDSNYLCLDEIVKRSFGDMQPTTEQVINFMDKICEEKIKPRIDACYTRLADYTNAYEQKMSMKRECLADTCIWQAKKRYIMNVWDSEGVRYDVPELKVMGMELIKSSTPMVCRNSLRTAVRMMLDSDEKSVQKYIKEFKKEFFKMTPNQVAFPRGVNNLHKYHHNDRIYKKGTPINVRGSLLYNRLIRDNNLTDTEELIFDGDRIYYLYLKEPNPIKENVVAFKNNLPPSLGLDKHIDYELQFTKTFLEPLASILDCIGWQAERRGSLLKAAKKKS